MQSKMLMEVSLRDIDCIMHIGFNKCGSTAIQKWLQDSSSELEAQKICYRRVDPRPDVVCSNPHLPIIAYTLSKKTIPFRPINQILGIESEDFVSQNLLAMKYIAEVENLLNNENYIRFVGSSEHLGARSFDYDAMKDFSSWLGSIFRSVKYIAYIRRPESWIVSSYGHHVRSGKSTETLDQFARRVKVAPYAKVLQGWLQAVDESALEVRLFKSLTRNSVRHSNTLRAFGL